MAMPDWDERYATDNLPWDTGRPSPHLIEVIERGTIPPSRVLEVGCGTGTNALWLAERGFEVLGVDISARAIAKAKAKAKAKAGANVEFRELDFLTAELDAAPFDFVFDRGVLHVFDDAASRATFARHVARVLAPGGHWLSIIGSTEGPERDQGPPRRTAHELLEAVEPELELVELQATTFDIDTPVKAWLLLTRTREFLAQPSTRRDG